MTHKELLVQQSYVTCEVIQPTEKFPNNKDLPLVIYKGALLLKPEDPSSEITDLLKSNGYGNIWEGDVYDYDHFHTGTHEVLAVYTGHAELIFGGDHGKCVEVNRGDVMIIPAGVAHKKQKSSDNFSCIGAYPDGKDFDMNTARTAGDTSEVKAVPLPGKDPVYGDAEGHLLSYWN